MAVLGSQQSQEENTYIPSSPHMHTFHDGVFFICKDVWGGFYLEGI